MSDWSYMAEAVVGAEAIPEAEAGADVWTRAKAGAKVDRGRHRSSRNFHAVGQFLVPTKKLAFILSS